jgi:hypothetical protein
MTERAFVRNLVLGMTFWILAASGCGGGCPGLGGDYIFPQSRIQERIFKTRLTRAGLDFLKPRLKDLLRTLLGADSYGRVRVTVPATQIGAIGDPNDPLAELALQDDPNTPARDDAGWVAIDFSSVDLALIEGPPPKIRFSIRDALVDLDLRAYADWGLGDAACYVRGAVDRGTVEQRALLLDLDAEASLTVGSNGNLQSTVTIPTLTTRDLKLQIDPASRTDPVCADGVYDGECENFCGAADAVAGIVTAIRDFLGAFLDAAIRLLVPPAIEGLLNGQPLKIQGQVALGDLLGSLLPSMRQARPLGFLLQPGPQGFVVDGTGEAQGLSLAMNGGLESSPAHPCVPPLDPLPLFTPGPFPALSGTDSQGRVYHMALTLSDAFLNEGGVAAYTSGALCLSVTSADISRASGGRFGLDAGALALLLPGLRNLTTNAAPVLIETVPTQPPRFKFGSGELQGSTRDSLLQLELDGLTISFYALVSDRYTRLFQFGTDLKVGLSLAVMPDNRILATIDSVKIQKLTELYNEIFRGSDLQPALRLLVDLITQALLGQGLEIPVDLNGVLPAQMRGLLEVQVNEVVRDGANRDFLTVSLTLVPPSAGRSQRFVAHTAAALSPEFPPMETDTQGRRLATGRIALDLGGAGRHGDASDLEYQVRLDRGPWSSFAPGPRLFLESPRLLVIGDHEVEVRARVRGEPRTLDPEPARIAFFVDPMAPRLWLAPGPDSVRLEADDERTPRERITFSWRMDEGPWSAFAPAAALALAKLPPGTLLSVRARDEAGNVSEPATTKVFRSEASPAAPSGPRTGCSAVEDASGPVSLLVPLLLILGLALGRRLKPSLLALVVAAPLLGCGDSTGSNTCQTDAQCPPGYRCVNNQCTPPRRCDDPLNPNPCCPGQICSAAGTCIDVPQSCQSDGTCERPGQVCSRPATDGGLSSDGGASEPGTCNYPTCETDDDCRGGASCFNGYCRLPVPCRGLCQHNEVCITPIDECYPAPAQCLAMTCAAGQIRVLDDVDAQVGEGCNLQAATCSCADLPQVPRGDWGRDSRIAVLGNGTPVVSAYDKTYGDLVLARYNSTGVLQQLEYLDGVPTDVAPVGRPSGIRAGVAAPGPNVGRYTSVAVDAAGNPILSYYDVDNADLKFAAWDTASSRWVTHTVDSTGDVGRYSHLVTGPGAIPAIVYFQMDSGLNDRVRGLKFARARGQNPRSAADWDVSVIESAAIPAPPGPPCGGCQSPQVCVQIPTDGGVTQSCLTPDNPPTCNPACQTGERCIAGVCRKEVLPPGPPLDDLPEGVGLFPSLAYSSAGVAHVVYYDRTNGNLKGARARNPAPAGPADWEVTVVDGQAGTFVDGDVGLFPSLAFAPDGRLGIAYLDATNNDLVFYIGSGFTGGSRELVDTGVSGAPLSLVGADASLAFAPDGTAYVVYQDSTYNDLKLGKRTGARRWEVSTLLREGAWGFFADLAISGGKLYVSNMRFSFDESAQPANEVRVLIQPLP